MDGRVIARLVILLGLLVLVGCQRTEWSETMPKQLVGNWTQVSDDIAAGRSKPSFFLLTPRGVVHHQYFDDGDRYEVRELPFIKISNKGNSFVVFCGKPDSNSIADHRYLFEVEEDASFASIFEIVDTGINNEDALFRQGRFVVK